jgi:hypothetical protein
MSSNLTGLQELSPGGIWIGERTLWFSGVRLRSRMTVVRLADGRLWVHSASEPTPELCAELDRLGQVSWVVVPNRYHHIHAAAMKARYPDAQVIGPASATLRNKSVALNVAIDDERLPSLVPELSPVALRGVPFLDETLFFHARTRTLIGADLMMCGCPADHWTSRGCRWSASSSRIQIPSRIGRSNSSRRPGASCAGDAGRHLRYPDRLPKWRLVAIAIDNAL